MLRTIVRSSIAVAALGLGMTACGSPSNTVVSASHQYNPLSPTVYHCAKGYVTVGMSDEPTKVGKSVFSYDEVSKELSVKLAPGAELSAVILRSYKNHASDTLFKTSLKKGGAASIKIPTDLYQEIVLCTNKK